MTVQEQILQAVVLALQGVAGVALVERSRKVGIDRDAAPAIIVRPDAEQDERFGAGTDKHMLDVLVIVHTRGDPWDAAAAPIVAAAHVAVMTNAGIAALAKDVRRISCDPEDVEADATAGQYLLRYRFTYLTRAADLSAQP